MNTHDLQSLLIDEGIVTLDQIRAARDAACDATSWLDQLLLTGQLDEATVTWYASKSLFVPRCDLDRLAHVPRSVIELVPRDLAIEHRVVPIGLETETDLALAMVDPSDRRAVIELEFFLGLRLLRQVAPATPMAWALTTYYGARCALWPRARAA